MTRLGAAAVAITLLGIVSCAGPQCSPAERNPRSFSAPLPADLSAGIPNSTPAAQQARLRTVRDSEARKRPVTLAECITLALENGRAGGSNIRVAAFEPAALAALVNQSLARFDLQWQTSVAWQKVDRPIATIEDTVLGAAPALQNDNARFESGLFKPLTTGGLAGITFRTDYQLTNLNAAINPAYTPFLGMVFEQPLLQGAGIFTNELRESHPAGVFRTLPWTPGAPAIALTIIGYEQSQTEFERQVQDLLLAVEEAYWNLHLSYWNLEAQTMALKRSAELLASAKTRFDAGDFRIQDLAQIEQQYHLFQVRQLDAMGEADGNPGVLEAERKLRFTVGLPPEDGTCLVPTDTPTRIEFQPNWDISLATALATRPELTIARRETEAARLNVLRTRNLILPDVRFFSAYEINGAGTRLDGPTPAGALASLGENRFQEWTMGVRVLTPLGSREAYAAMRRAEVRLAQRTAACRDLEEQVAFEVQRSQRSLVQSLDRIRLLGDRLRAAKVQYDALVEEFKAGLGSTNVLLESQRDWVSAQRDLQAAIIRYNINLADYQRRVGTIMQYENVVVTDGPSPATAVRASETVRAGATCACPPVTIPVEPARPAPNTPATTPEQLPFPKP